MNPWILLTLWLFCPAPPLPGPADLDEARALLAEGRPADALKVLQGVSPPESPEAQADAFLLAGRCHLALDDAWSAEEAYASAEGLVPSAESASGIGLAYLALAEEQVRGDAPSGAEIRALCADAIASLQRARKRDPASLAPLRPIGRAHMLAGEPDRAAEAWRTLAEASPQDADARHLLATALRAGGDRAGAAEAEAACLALDGTRIDAAADLVGDLAATTGHDAARRIARRTLLDHPGANAVYAALWRVDAIAERYLPMEEVFLAVLARHPSHPVALYFLAFARRDSGRLDEALEAFRQRVAVPPASPRAHLEIGRILETRGDVDGAGTAYLAAIDLADAESQDRLDSLAGLARVGARWGVDSRYRDALRVYARLVKESPDTPEYHMFLGLSHRRLGEFDAAAAAFEAAQALQPFDGNATNELGLLRLAQGDREAARAAFQSASERDPVYTDGLENLGALARMDGDIPAALGYFREAHRRAMAVGNEEGRLKFRRYLDLVAGKRSF